MRTERTHGGDTLIVRCLRCDGPTPIKLTSRTHPSYCEECQAILDDALRTADATPAPSPSPSAANPDDDRSS